MTAFNNWLLTTGFSLWVQANAEWLWPLSEALHFVGLAMLVGIAGFLDLRLLGFMRSVPVKAVKDFLPWSFIGFALVAATGIAFYASQPWQYARNPTWWFKVFFIVLAGANALLFETALAHRAMALGPNENTTVGMKMVGATSLMSWLMVLYCGRMLAFTQAD
ncbi:MAG: hypothetical protein AB7I50_21680 [Vicinamibacterales bacterium]